MRGKKIHLFIFLLILTTSVYPHPGQKRIILTFLGDIMAHTVNYVMSDYNSIYDRVEDLLKEDALTFANLESPVDSTRQYSTYPKFNIGTEYVQAAVDAGIEVFSLANNHAYDYGQEGLFQTLRSMARIEKIADHKIYYSGIRGNLMASFEPVEINIKGLRIGFLAVTQMTNVWQKYNHHYVHVVDYNNAQAKEALLGAVRKFSTKYDLFILSYHGGVEYALKPDPGKVRFFHQLLEAGVHIVYGHHPHVLQPFRLVNVEGKNRLIIFSAGNFISGMTWRMAPSDYENPIAFTGDSALLVVEISFTNREEYLQASVDAVRPVLITNVKNEKGELVVDTFLRLLEQNLSEEWSDFYRSRYRIMEALIHD